jgi:hypothetical protein
MLLVSLVAQLRVHLKKVKILHEQDLLAGHFDVSITTIYTHVLNRGGKGVVSLLDQIGR